MGKKTKTVVSDRQLTLAAKKAFPRAAWTPLGSDGLSVMVCFHPLRETPKDFTVHANSREELLEKLLAEYVSLSAPRDGR